MSSAVGVSPDGPERRNDLRAEDVIADVWNKHDMLLHGDPEDYDSLACDGCDWVGPTSGFNTHLASAVLTALAAAGFAVVRSKDVLRAFDCGPNFLDARGRLIEEAREARATFLAACTHPAESIVDGECWRCDSPVAAGLPVGEEAEQ